VRGGRDQQDTPLWPQLDFRLGEARAELQGREVQRLPRIKGNDQRRATAQDGGGRVVRHRYHQPADRGLGGKYLFLSAGSGITPLMSMTRSHHDLASGADIAFVHSARSPADLIFRDELALMAKTAPGLTVTAICEADSNGEVWSGHRGRIDLSKLEAIVPDFREREVYICGPAPYMAAVKTMLEASGFDMARYYSESFDFAELSADQAEPEAAASSQGFKVEFKLSRRTIEVAPDRFILAAAKAEGMRLPSSCTKGMCEHAHRMRARGIINEGVNKIWRESKHYTATTRANTHTDTNTQSNN
jgi:ferredoxin